MGFIKYASLFFGYILIMSIILLIVISGIGYMYFKSGIMMNSYDINLRVLFGCGIGVGLILFIIIWIFFGFPKFFLNYFLTFPLTIIMCVLYIFYTRPSKFTQYEMKLSSIWSEGIVYRRLQMNLQCCGWFNASDRAIKKCPIHFESGCAHVFTNYFKPRIGDIFLSSIVILIINVISVVSLLVMFYCFMEESSFLELFGI